MREDGYYLNVARYTDVHAWDSTTTAPKYTCSHYCSIYLGRLLPEAAQATAADLATRFPEGTRPGYFKLDLTFWQALGNDVAFERTGAA